MPRLVDRIKPGAGWSPPPQSDPRGRPELRLRIEMLRQKARIKALETLDTVNTIAILLIIGGLGIPALGMITGRLHAHGPLNLWLLTFVGCVPIFFAFYGGHVLISSFMLIDRQTTWPLKLLRQTSLGIILVHEEYWGELASQHAQLHPLAPSDQPLRADIEQVLTWSAFHFNSLIDCYQRQHTNLAWRYALEQQAFMLSGPYAFSPTLVGCCGAAVLLFLPVLLPVHALYCWVGIRRITALCRLVAICDFLLATEVDPNAVV